MVNKNITSKMPQYFLDKNTGVYFSESKQDFNYSDGDTVEDALLSIILSAKDISVGSPDLTQNITNWPSRYHLSPQRVDLLRPLQDILKGDILEIGSGCGAITRYLGELGENIVAIEGSAKRAQITAARCRDLSNVKVYCENFNDFIPNKKYDVITLIGVLEYSPMFIKGEFPPQIMLEKIKSFLKPHGVLIIAIENQLGLKYFAGAPEDHLGIPFAGIENKYQKDGPITFGKKKLENYLNDVGLKQIDFLYPFPDYKFPAAIITENGCRDKNINLTDILRHRIKYFQQNLYVSSFDEEKALATIIENEFIEEFSNSFLIVAGFNKKKNIDSDILLYSFNKNTKKEFCWQNKFVIINNEYWVIKNKIYPQLKCHSNNIHHQLENEKYIFGQSYSNELFEINEKRDLTIEKIIEWAKPWINYLLSKSITTDMEGFALLNGKYFDATPFNIVKDKKNNAILSTFNLEWIIKKDLRVDYIVFRGLYYLLIKLTNISQSVTNGYRTFSDICIEMVKALFPRYNINVDLYRQYEMEIINQIIEKQSTQFFTQLVPDSSYSLTKEITLFNYLSEFNIQIFWASHTFEFSEKQSKNKYIKISSLKNSVSFTIAPQTEYIDFFRFDIGNRAGIININDIEIKNNKDEIIWTWDPHLILNKSDLLFLENTQYVENKIMQIAFSADPQFIVATNDLIKTESANGLVVLIYLSEVIDEQLEIFNNCTFTYAYPKMCKK
jgi:SAM-dependent methyltransferase